MLRYLTLLVSITSAFGLYANPLVRGADPFVLTHSDTFYVLITRQFDISIYPVSNLNDLEHVEPQRVWCIDIVNVQTDVWAPEFVYMNGTYYILSTGRRTQESPYEMFVLESTIPDDPMGPYEFRGFLDLQGAIDGSAFEWEGQMYLLWSQLEPIPGAEGLQQCNWIAALGSDWGLTERTRLSCADHAWEMVGNRVNEGPQALERDGRLFVVFSASLTLSTEYCLGLLEFKSGNVLEAANWFKHVQPVFQSDPQEGVYGPGHHTIARNPLTDEWMLVYHAKYTTDWTADDRLVQAKTFSWDREGRPVFGRPSPYERSPLLMPPVREGTDCPPPPPEPESPGPTPDPEPAPEPTPGPQPTPVEPPPMPVPVPAPLPAPAPVPEPAPQPLPAPAPMAAVGPSPAPLEPPPMTPLAPRVPLHPWLPDAPTSFPSPTNPAPPSPPNPPPPLPPNPPPPSPPTPTPPLSPAPPPPSPPTPPPPAPLNPPPPSPPTPPSPSPPMPNMPPPPSPSTPPTPLPPSPFAPPPPSPNQPPSPPPPMPSSPPPPSPIEPPTPASPTPPSLPSPLPTSPSPPSPGAPPTPSPSSPPSPPPPSPDVPPTLPPPSPSSPPSTPGAPPTPPPPSRFPAPGSPSRSPPAPAPAPAPTPEPAPAPAPGPLASVDEFSL